MWANACHHVLSLVSPDTPKLSAQSAALLNDTVNHILRGIVMDTEQFRNGSEDMIECIDSTFQQMVDIPLPLSGDIATGQSVRLAIAAASVGSPAQKTHPDILTTGMVQELIPKLLPGILGAQGVQSVQKFVEYFKQNPREHEAPSLPGGMLPPPRLLISPERVALRLNLVFQVTPTSLAAVYVAALVEYLLFALLEGTVSAARNSSASDIIIDIIEPCHLRATATLDPDLSASKGMALLLDDRELPSIPEEFLEKLQCPALEVVPAARLQDTINDARSKARSKEDRMGSNSFTSCQYALVSIFVLVLSIGLFKYFKMLPSIVTRDIHAI